MKAILPRLLLLALLFIHLSCSKDDVMGAFDGAPIMNVLTLNDIKTNGEEMFDDAEPVDVLVSEARHFNVDAPFNVTLKNGRLRIFNMVPHTFQNVTVWMTIASMGETVKLLEIEEMPGMFVSELESPLQKGEAIYLSKSGKPVKTKNLSLLSANQVEFTLQCNDPVMDMLHSIKMKTRIQMGRYGEGNWGVMTANAARQYAAGSINLAVMFSSKQFRDALMKYDKSLHGNDGKTQLDREKLLKEMLDKPLLNMGVVTGAGIAGLGGGAAFGLVESYLPGLFYHNRVQIDCNWVLHVWIHEFGHCLGYSHESSLCYGALPDDIVPTVYRQMMKNKQLPVVVNPFKTGNGYVPGADDNIEL